MAIRGSILRSGGSFYRSGIFLILFAGGLSTTSYASFTCAEVEQDSRVEFNLTFGAAEMSPQDLVQRLFACIRGQNPKISLVEEDFQVPRGCRVIVDSPLLVRDWRSGRTSVEGNFTDDFEIWLPMRQECQLKDDHLHFGTLQTVFFRFQGERNGKVDWQDAKNSLIRKRIVFLGPVKTNVADE